MVFKILQVFPLGLKSLIFQAGFMLLVLFFVFVFNGSPLSFLFGFLFSQLYMPFFFKSGALFLDPKTRKLGMLFLFLKWILLICVLICVFSFLDGPSFLIGLSGLLSFLLCYVLENRNNKDLS